MRARITSICKGFSPMNPSNYRPVSILFMHENSLKGSPNQLTQYLKRHSILYDHQSVFREKHSTLTAVTDVSDCILRCAKECQLTNLLEKHSFALIGMTEPFQHNNNSLDNFHPDYTWIGNARKYDNKKGDCGIGLLMHNTTKVQNENILNTMDDTFERLRDFVKIGQLMTAVGIVYFPNDGANKE